MSSIETQGQNIQVRTIQVGNYEVPFRASDSQFYPRLEHLLSTYARDGKALPVAPYLIEPGEELTPELRVVNSLLAFIRTVESKENNGTEVIRAGEPGGQPTFTEDTLPFYNYLDLAPRAVNGWRRDIHLTLDGNPSKFGQLLDEALENPALSDHNYWHLRRTEHMLRDLLAKTPELQQKHVRKWIDSAFLFVNRHDDDQLISIQRNLREGTNLKVKKGHALAGAVMMLADDGRYDYWRHVSPQESWRIRKGAALMMLRHDEPEQIHAILNGVRDATGLSGKDLYDGFFNAKKIGKAELALHTISSHQILELCQMEKQKYGFTSDRSVYGLSPEFEEERAEELQALWEDHTPLFNDITAQDWDGLALMTEVGTFCDLYDMVAPAHEAIYRTVLTQYSQDRPWMSRDSAKFRAYVNSELKKAGREALADDATFEDYYVDLILYGDGNTPEEYADQDSDLRRILMEFRHLISKPEKFSSYSPDTLMDYPYPRQVSIDTALQGILAISELGNHFMRGEISPLEASVRKSSYRLGKKFLRHLGYSSEEIQNIEIGINDTLEDFASSAGEIPTQAELTVFLGEVRRLIYSKDPNQVENFNHFLVKVRSVTEHILHALGNKNLSLRGDGAVQLEHVMYQNIEGKTESMFLEVYPEAQIASFNRIVERLVTHIMEQCYYQGIEDDIATQKTLVRKQEYSWSVPIDTYESTGTKDRARTIVRPRTLGTPLAV